VLLVFSLYYLDAAIYDNLQDLKEEDFEWKLARNPSKCSLTILIVYALLKFNTYALIPLGLGFMDG
jgi:hypothetical protein